MAAVFWCVCWQTLEDEGFMETTPSSVTSSLQSVMDSERSSESADIWTAAVHHKLDEHYTWEAVGRYDSVDVDIKYSSPVTERVGCDNSF